MFENPYYLFATIPLAAIFTVLTFYFIGKYKMAKGNIMLICGACCLAMSIVALVFTLKLIAGDYHEFDFVIPIMAIGYGLYMLARVMKEVDN